MFFLLIVILSPLLVIILERREINDWHSFFDQYFTTLFSLVLVFIILSALTRAIQNWFANALQRENLEKQSMRAELAYLKSQINPHFLFNTLNNIYTLAYIQSPATPEAIMRLSSLMRYMLYESNANTVSLEREINYLKDFIELQQLRFKVNEIVNLEIIGGTENANVAPLLFVHIIENAYKHSPANLQAGDIVVRVEVNENRLIFKAKNPVAKQSQKPMDEPGGFGLENVKKRLNLLYPNDHSFQVNTSHDQFEVVMSVPIKVQGDER